MEEQTNQPELQLTNWLIYLFFLSLLGCQSARRSNPASSPRPLAAIPRLDSEAAFDSIARPLDDRVSYAWYCIATAPAKINAYFINTPAFSSPIEFAQRYLRPFDSFKDESFIAIFEDPLDERLKCGALIRVKTATPPSAPLWMVTSLGEGIDQPESIARHLDLLHKRVPSIFGQLAFAFTNPENFLAGKAALIAAGIPSFDIHTFWPNAKSLARRVPREMVGFLTPLNIDKEPNRSNDVIVVAPDAPPAARPNQKAAVITNHPPHPLSLAFLKWQSDVPPFYAVSTVTDASLEKHQGKLVVARQDQSGLMNFERTTRFPPRGNGQAQPIADTLWLRPLSLDSTFITREAFGHNVTMLRDLHSSIRGLAVNLTGVALPYRFYQNILNSKLTIEGCKNAAGECSAAGHFGCKRAVALCYAQAQGDTPTLAGLIESLNADVFRSEWSNSYSLLGAVLHVVRTLMSHAPFSEQDLELIDSTILSSSQRNGPYLALAFSESTDSGPARSAFRIDRLACPMPTQAASHTCLASEFRDRLLGHINSISKASTPGDRVWVKNQEQALISPPTLASIIKQSYADQWTTDRFLRREKDAFDQTKSMVSVALIALPNFPTVNCTASVRSLGPREGFEVALAAQKAPMEPDSSYLLEAIPEKLLVKADRTGKILGFRRISFSNQIYPQAPLLGREPIARIVTASIAVFQQLGENSNRKAAYRSIISKDGAIVFLPQL